MNGDLVHVTVLRPSGGVVWAGVARSVDVLGAEEGESFLHIGFDGRLWIDAVTIGSVLPPYSVVVEVASGGREESAVLL